VPPATLGAELTEGAPRKRGRTALLAVLAVSISVGFVLAAAEVAARFLPLGTMIFMVAPDSTNPVWHFQPNQHFTYSKGWNFAILNRGRINNAGWVNDQDYDQAARTPLLAVLGDSYVEAFMVPYDSTLQGRLAREIAGRGRVYSFGLSGAPLSEYLAQAEYVRERYHPAGFSIVVVGNDFDESLTRYKSAPLLHYFREDPAGGLTWGFPDSAATPGSAHSVGSPAEAQRSSSPPATSVAQRITSATRRDASRVVMAVLSRSRLYDYLVSNVGLTKGRQRLRSGFSRQPNRAFVANTGAEADSLRVTLSRRAVDEFLVRLPTAAGVSPGRIVLVVDGVRPIGRGPAYRRAVRESYFGVMRTYLIEQARAKGFHIVDLQPRFEAQYRADGKRFEWPTDGHWNARGHGVAAAAVAETPVVRDLFAPR
jgi:hypothetical protein